MGSPLDSGADAPIVAPRWVLLADGSTAELRGVTETDREALRELHRSASDESIYRRFFTLNRAAAINFVDVICGPPTTTLSAVAVRAGQLAGVATASVDSTGTTAEVSFLIDDRLHGLGLATSLLEQLAEWSRQRGIETFSADVLAENLPMLRVFHDAGFQLSEQREHSVVSLTMDLQLSPALVAASDARERHAEAQSLAHVFEPRTVAVLGVSRTRGSIGREVLENIRASGYSGRTFALGRAELELEGTSCVTEIADLPRDLDLAVVAVPAAQVEQVVRSLAERGARSCIVLTAGLGETGEAGHQLERRLADTAREHSMRLIGPNCFGVLSNLRTTRLDVTFGTVRPRPGTLAIGSQSGGVGVALLEAGRRRDTGLACFVSLGNKADVSGNDLLAAWTDDPQVGAAALYLESFHDPRQVRPTRGDFQPHQAAAGGVRRQFGRRDPGRRLAHRRAGHPGAGHPGALPGCRRGRDG